MAEEGGRPEVRHRCTACGNLTRFDVVRTTRTRSFHHFTVGGELNIEEEVVLSDVVEEVSCRWCGSSTNVIEIDQIMVKENPAAVTPSE